MSLRVSYDETETIGGAEMLYHVVSYKELPSRLRINGLPCTNKADAGQHLLRDAHEFHYQEASDYIYTCYGSRPRAPALHEYGPWLVETAPFFVEVERNEFAGWTKEDKVLPKEISIGQRKFVRAFDRYYFGVDLNDGEIRFVFDYMAPTYEADINYWMNLDVNGRLLDSIATFDLPMPTGGKPVEILDYGVGTGICANAQCHLKEDTWGDWGIVGLDVSREMVKQARQKRREEDPESLLLDAYEIKEGVAPIPSASFSAAMACFTVQYFLDPRPYREIHRLLIQGAPFVCNVLLNEMNRIESYAKQVGLILQKGHRQELDYEVRGQPVCLLAFIKEAK